jgi:hypothetical protein
MRVAGMAFAKLRGPRNTYALLINRGRLKHNNERILTPIGGGVEIEAEGLSLLKRLGATDFDGGEKELRCRVPDNNVVRVASWFRSASYREHTVLRELGEELVDETGILGAHQLRGIEETYEHFSRHNAMTKRNVPDKETAYLADVFRVTVPPAVMLVLASAAELPVKDRLLYFVSEAEILNGKTRSGVAIGDICKTLLH